VADDVEERLQTLLETGRRYKLFGDETASAATCTKVSGPPPTVVPGMGDDTKELHRRVRAWRDGQDPDRPGQPMSIDALEMEQLQALVPVAQGVGQATGMDAERVKVVNERLTQIWNLTKKGIRQRDFRDPNERTPTPSPSEMPAYGPGGPIQYPAPPPLKSDEEESADRQAYRVRLYKRITLAYLDALLSARETIPECCVPHEIRGTVQVNGQQFPKVGCEDPVIEGLVAYGKAIQEIGSAEDEMLRADYELLIQKQQLTADVLSVIPVAGEFLDIYSLWADENLAGNCLTRFEKVLIPVMLAVPFIGPQAVKAALARSPRAAAAVQRFAVWFDTLSMRFADYTEAIARRWNRTPADVDAIEKALKEAAPLPHGIGRELDEVMAKINALPDDELRRFNPSEPDVTKIRQKLKDDATIYDNLRKAGEDRIWIRHVSPELRERAIARSKKVMEENLDKLQESRKAVVQASNMVEEHLDAIEVLVKVPGEPKVLVFRFVEADATELIRMGYGTKGMNVKGKSANWGPHAGFIPVDQKFSKLGNPKKALDGHEADKIKKFHEQVRVCLEQGKCFQTDAVRPDKSTVLVLGDTGRLVLQTPEGAFLDPSTMKAVTLTADEAGAAKSMKVLALTDNGKPLTADYDFLAFGTEGPHRSPAFNTDTGFITKKQEEILGQVNDAVKKAGYEGGNIAHHGAETFYPGSPGALKVDPVVTAIDPKRGLVTIPRCDAKCMERWCKTTRACGGLPICGDTPTPPCLPVDPDRLLKDFFHAKRLEGFNLDPNPVWGWGSYNVLGGWTVQGFLEQGVVGQLRTMGPTAVTREMALAAQRAILTGLKRGAHYIFECSPSSRWPNRTRSRAAGRRPSS
jgi:hypothetical protein